MAVPEESDKAMIGNQHQRILAVDPGPTRSAWVLFDMEREELVRHEIAENQDLVDDLHGGLLIANQTVVEMIACYGMPVGRDVFETCVWIGRIVQACKMPFSFVYRKDVKLHLCGSARARDANVRQVLIDRFGPGRDKAIGRKAQPGPLYGVKKDIWAALGVAVTHSDEISLSQSAIM